jgi:hypothetical protein
MSEEEWKKWFTEYPLIVVSVESGGVNKIEVKSITKESLYQAFKARLASEAAVNLFPNDTVKK